MTTCIESLSCIPQNPMEVLKLYDIQYGAGMTLVVMALIIGSITLAIYIRNRSLPMLAILAIYEAAVFGSILTAPIFASQYHIMVYVIIMAGATALVMVILRLVKE